MKKLLLATTLATFALGALTACETPPADQTSTNKNPAQWQQFRSKKGVEELDANTQQIDNSK